MENNSKIIEKRIQDKLVSLKIKKVIIWGHSLHKSTHSYIHNAWFRAFKYLKINVFWFTNESNVSDFDFNNSLFFTEGNVDDKIPINYNSYYILHNCWDLGKKYKKLIYERRVMVIQKYEHVVKNNGYSVYKNKPNHYYHKKKIILSLPWATDLLPHMLANTSTDKNSAGERS